MGTVAHYLPEWALWAQLRATSLVAVAAASGALYFGWWQQRIARERLRHDEFDKRSEIFDLMHGVHMAMLARRVPHVIEDRIDGLMKIAHRARFLFGDELGGSIREQGSAIWRAFHLLRYQLKHTSVTNERNSHIAAYQAEIDGLEKNWGMLIERCAEVMYLNKHA